MGQENLKNKIEDLELELEKLREQIKTQFEYVTKVQVRNKIQIPKSIREAMGGIESGEKVRILISKENKEGNKDGR